MNKLDVARVMPPLHHSIPGAEFDIMRSEVAAWLAAQPELREFLFQEIKRRKLIVYNHDAGTWEGNP